VRLLPIVAIAIVCPLILTSCTTDRDFCVSHERLVDAAIQAISEETRVAPGDIKRTETSEKGGMRTVLVAPYITYSCIKVEVDSTDEHCKCPELQVKVTTDKILWTRHKDFEDRIHEIVALKLRARKHGDESKPTALPTKAPAPTPAPLPPPQK
jgi:hypothetical protein